MIQPWCRFLGGSQCGYVVEAWRRYIWSCQNMINGQTYMYLLMIITLSFIIKLFLLSENLFLCFGIYKIKNYNCKYFAFIWQIYFNHQIQCLPVFINSTWILMLVSIDFQQSKLSWVLTRPLNLLGFISETWVLSSMLWFFIF